jgi:hypothetical protein
LLITPLSKEKNAGAREKKNSIWKKCTNAVPVFDLSDATSKFIILGNIVPANSHIKPVKNEIKISNPEE